MKIALIFRIGATNENIRALIKRLRKKLPNDTIVSQGGMGYVLNVVKKF